MIPANAGGAGIGSLNTAKRNPTIIPVMSDSSTSFMPMKNWPPSLLVEDSVPI